MTDKHGAQKRNCSSAFWTRGTFCQVAADNEGALHVFSVDVFFLLFFDILPTRVTFQHASQQNVCNEMLGYLPGQVRGLVFCVNSMCFEGIRLKNFPQRPTLLPPRHGSYREWRYCACLSRYQATGHICVVHDVTRAVIPYDPLSAHLCTRFDILIVH